MHYFVFKTLFATTKELVHDTNETSDAYFSSINLSNFSFANVIRQFTSSSDLLKFSVLNAYTVTSGTPSSKHQYNT